MTKNEWGNKWSFSFKTSGEELKKVITVNKSEPKNLYVKGSCEEGIMTLYIIKDTVIDAFDITAQNDELAINLSKYGEGRVELLILNNKAKNAEFTSYWE
jgi:hypothetical protein